jgi:hypothetical protein
MDPLDRRLDELETAFGVLMADLAKNLIELKARIESLKKFIESKDHIIEMAFDLEDDRHKLVMEELTRLAQEVSAMQRRSWHESDNLRDLAQLRRERHDSGGTNSLPPPASKGSSQQRMKLLGALSALIIALGTLATAVTNACNQIDWDPPKHHNK